MSGTEKVYRTRMKLHNLLFSERRKREYFVFFIDNCSVFRGAQFSRNRPVDERPESGQDRKIKFAIFTENLSIDPSKLLFYRRRIAKFYFALLRNTRVSIFGFLAISGGSSPRSTRNFLAESEKSIFVAYNRLFRGRGQARKNRILNSSQVL